MAEGYISNPMIQYKDLNLGAITLDNDGYYHITSKPSGMTKFLYAIAYEFSQAGNSSNRSFFVDGRGEWIAGIPNTNITGLHIRYYYYD